MFGAVRVRWRDTEVRNLYLITYEVENASLKDFENVALTAFTGNDTMLFGERAGILDTPDILAWSPSFQRQLAVQPGEAPTAEQWQTYQHRREYSIPVLNRGQKVSLQYVCTRPHDDELPHVHIHMPVKGVRLVRQQTMNFILGVPGERALTPGLTMAVLISATSAAYFHNTWLVATVSLLAGSTGLLIGALLFKGWQRLRRRVFG